MVLELRFALVPRPRLWPSAAASLSSTSVGRQWGARSGTRTTTHFRMLPFTHESIERSVMLLSLVVCGPVEVRWQHDRAQAGGLGRKKDDNEDAYDMAHRAKFCVTRAPVGLRPCELPSRKGQPLWFALKTYMGCSIIGLTLACRNRDEIGVKSGFVALQTKRCSSSTWMEALWQRWAWPKGTEVMYHSLCLCGHSCSRGCSNSQQIIRTALVA